MPEQSIPHPVGRTLMVLIRRMVEEETSKITRVHAVHGYAKMLDSRPAKKRTTFVTQCYERSIAQSALIPYNTHMRILLINKYHYLRRGAERAYLDTARILADRGHSVAYFSMEHPENLPTEWNRFFVSNAEYQMGKQLGFWFKAKLALRLIWNREAQVKLAALIREFQPDIAHLHNIYHQLSPSILWTLRRHNVPMVMTLHDFKLLSPNHDLFVRGKIWEHTSGFRCILDRCVKDSYLKSLDAALEQWLHRVLGSYRLVDRFLSPSQFLANLLRHHGRTYPLSVLPQPLVPFPTLVPTRGDHLLYFGALSEEKGVALLLEALSRLPNERLTIVGSGPAEEELRDMAQALRLTNVTFAGAQYGAALEKEIAAAKAVIVPSLWYDNMPYVPLEALARGKPVIAARTGGIPERVHEGENGFLFERGSVQALVEAIERLNQTDLAKLRLQARESVRDLRPEIYGAALERIYSEILAARRKA